MDNLSQFETDLWSAADNLRANSKLTSSDYFMPVLGIIFLRHAANRFDVAARQIAEDQASGKMPKRKVQPADYIRRRALFLPEEARFDNIMERASTDPAGLPQLVSDAMEAIEKEFKPLLNVLPKDYGIFEPKVLEELMRLFNSEQIKRATGDVFGRIYEYFLAKFSIQKAHDNGEFFTPSSIVQLLVNVIEPNHGNVFDPACGSCGMFAQTSHFIEHEGGDTNRKVVFYGQEKNRDTIRIAKMNLAVHGLEGKISEAISYYQDEHNLAPREAMGEGGCDFVMANPPFNVDLVDAERIKNDPRLPFGLPGVNKDKRVSNGNYLWISYFWSYLNAKGRAGFVMSSQASSAGNDEKTVRQKLVETGDVDVMISIKGGFFYTRTVPCELWYFDRNKPAGRKDQVLMLDARSIGQLMKGSRKVHEFTPEQMRNLTAIVWLYRGQKDRFIGLVQDYFTRHAAECAAVPETIAAFDTALAALDAPFAALSKVVKATTDLDAEKAQALTDTQAELRDARKACTADAKTLLADVAACVKKLEKTPPATNAQHKARQSFDPVAERAKGLIKQVDLLYKLASRVASNANDLTDHEAVAEAFDRRATGRLIKQLDEARRAAAEQLKHATYFHRQIAWLQDRFPKAEMQPVPGLVKVVTRADIEAADWSLTPGRYVGVAPAEVDEDFDFEQAITEIHEELAGLNAEAVDLAATIQKNLEELGV
ncbi:type I restriction-modification system subunit M [Haloferula sp.]|uniref:type I restriction-modification system subunit M n=1 Tax=Haloferula sp. TaxID=2497595 RepID=UPI003C738A20